VSAFAGQNEEPDFAATSLPAPAPSRWRRGVARPAAGTKQTAILALVSGGGLLVSLNQSILVPVLPRLTVDLHASGLSAEWLLTSTLMVAAVAVPIVGRLADLYGKKRLLVICLAAFVAGSLLCAVSGNLGLLIAGRAVTGLSMAAIPLGISLVSAALPPERADSGIALISAMLGIGGALGLPVTGLIAEHRAGHRLTGKTARETSYAVSRASPWARTPSHMSVRMSSTSPSPIGSWDMLASARIRCVMISRTRSRSRAGARSASSSAAK
jgi:MFS family permease